MNAAGVQAVTIPAEAFPTTGEYVVGVAAFVATLPRDLDQLDPERTVVRAGRLAFWRVHVGPAR